MGPQVFCDSVHRKREGHGEGRGRRRCGSVHSKEGKTKERDGVTSVAASCAAKEGREKKERGLQLLRLSAQCRREGPQQRWDHRCCSSMHSAGEKGAYIDETMGDANPCAVQARSTNKDKTVGDAAACGEQER
ncbi:hypothetical protein AMTR_s00112p00046700 [Amborella trichopoda]|uniref:Uncharacterized protein n=1 Tax=Amborella trichopoda TaxID=13333 RepID=W1NSK8_AMBTC|nr:hypothetical protein AMTR_s00112p00046700 [Amborella trichopoda]